MPVMVLTLKINNTLIPSLFLLLAEWVDEWLKMLLLQFIRCKSAAFLIVNGYAPVINPYRKYLTFKITRSQLHLCTNKCILSKTVRWS
jgi:hypothetical protein